MCDGGRNGPLAGRGGGLAAVALKVAIAVMIATVLQMMVETKRGTLQQLMMLSSVSAQAGEQERIPSLASMMRLPEPQARIEPPVISRPSAKAAAPPPHTPLSRVSDVRSAASDNRQ